MLPSDFVREAGLPTDPEGQRAAVATWHRRKTEIYKGMVQAGKLPGRPGVARIIGDALAAGWPVAVASTSAEASVRAVVEHVLGPDLAARVAVYAGDIVPAKKPDPAIYNLAVDDLGLDRDRTLVIEDSRNGLLAAVGAGLRCLVTVNDYTRDEDFDEAVLVVSELGDPGGEPIEVIANRGRARPGPYLTLDDLAACMADT
jgi:HAD superfamily hydrolase (TIGR01509 family)